jgi:hypothetical protein
MQLINYVQKLVNPLKYVFNNRFLLICKSGSILPDQLALRIYGRMILATEKRLSVFLRPSSINVFLAQLLRMAFPIIWCFAFLNLFILVTAVALARHFDKARIYYLSLLGRRLHWADARTDQTASLSDRPAQESLETAIWFFDREFCLHQEVPETV